MTDREIMQQALEALEYPGPSWPEARQSIATALRERLAQHEALDQLIADSQAMGAYDPPCKTGASCVGGKCPQCEAQPEQEPVAWMWKDGTVTADPDRADGTWTPLYTAPQPREWVGLTEEEFSHGLQMSSNTSWMKAAKWAEAKLREKNA